MNGVLNRLKLCTLDLSAKAVRYIEKPTAASLRYLRTSSRKLRLAQMFLRYEGERDDIFIVAYPKSGTTWMQMILYQLTTDGRMTLNHIDDFSPHLEESFVDSGRWINDVPKPRIIKSHLEYKKAPKGPGRYIYVMRNGLDVAVSFYHQLLHRDPGSFAEFFEQFINGRVPYGSWFAHVKEWTDNPDRLNVLLVSYEDLVSDLEASVRKICTFCDIEVPAEEWPRIIHNCSFGFMKQHESKFNLAMRVGAQRRSAPELIRQGGVGGWRSYMDTEMLNEYYTVTDHTFHSEALERYRRL